MAEQEVLIFENKNDIMVERDEFGRLKKGNSLSPSTKFPKGHIPWNKGKEFIAVKGDKNSMKRPEVVAKLKANPNNIRTQFKKGIVPWNKGLKNPYSEEARKKLHLISKPNKEEKKLNTILQAVFLEKFRFVGDWSFYIDRLNPDFVSVDGSKLVIDLFGEYWHKEGTEEERSKRFAKEGYRSLVIWVKELDDRMTVINKINDFINDKEVDTI